MAAHDAHQTSAFGYSNEFHSRFNRRRRANPLRLHACGGYSTHHGSKVDTMGHRGHDDRVGSGWTVPRPYSNYAATNLGAA